MLCETCNSILLSIKKIRAVDDYESWREEATVVEGEVIDIYSKLNLLKMISSKNLTSYHYTKLSYALSTAVNAELNIKVDRVLQITEDETKFNYYYHQISEIYRNAE